MRTRFYNARILTMKDFDVFSGEVWIEDNKIIYVGKVKTSQSREPRPCAVRG